VNNNSNRDLLLNDSIDDLPMGTVSNISRNNKSFTCHIWGMNFPDQLTLDAHQKLDHSSAAEEPAGVG
jgi:hypothetical protein